MGELMDAVYNIGSSPALPAGSRHRVKCLSKRWSLPWEASSDSWPKEVVVEIHDLAPQEGCSLSWLQNPAICLTLRGLAGYSYPGSLAHKKDEKYVKAPEAAWVYPGAVMVNVAWCFSRVLVVECPQDKEGKPTLDMLDIDWPVTSSWFSDSHRIAMVLEGDGRLTRRIDREEVIDSLKAGDTFYLPPEIECSLQFAGKMAVVSIKSHLEPVTFPEPTTLKNALTRLLG